MARSRRNDPDKLGGNVGMPAIGPGMNKIPDTPSSVGSGAKEDDEDVALLQRARKRFDRSSTYDENNRKAGLEDDKMYNGQQWPSDVAAQRTFDHRPCLTLNQFPTLVHQVTNDQRQNRPGINVSPVGDRGDPEAAKMFMGLIRFIERASEADIAYDTAYESAVRKGWGYWRVVTEYENPDSFDQCVVIKRIRNSYTVYMDPAAQEPEGADARYAFITEMLPRSEFEEEYPDANPMHWTLAGIGDGLKNWIAQNEVRIAEYFEIEHEKRRLVRLANGHEGWFDELSDEAKKIEIIAERESFEPMVYWYKITAMEVLEKRKWPGKWIPIVRVIGDEMDLEGKVYYSGMIRHAHDAQRQYNYMRCLALDTPLPTPSGWTTMGVVAPGDMLFDEKGTPTRVLGVSPVHINKQCFEIVFSDGSKIVADADHLWRIERRRLPKGGTPVWEELTIPTCDMQGNRDYIVSTSPLDLPSENLPIDPYLLGAWLGDGYSSSPSLCASHEDIGEMRETLENRGYRLSPLHFSKDRVPNFTVLGQKEIFRKIGILGNKHIPASYLRASPEQRWELLRGLMDTDGTINKSTHQCSFTTTSPHIASGFSELIRSLGIKSTFVCRKSAFSKLVGYNHEPLNAWVFSFSCLPNERVFQLERKRVIQQISRPSHYRRHKRIGIKSITPIASVPVKCVAVDSPSHLFLAGEAMIPTHNTSFVETVALAPRAPFIMAEGQQEGHEELWKQANVRNFPYLLYKPVDVDGKPAPPPQRQQPVQPPSGLVEGAREAAQDVMSITGIRFNANPQQERMYDESGRALRELRRAGDIGSFHYIDNLARALRHTGEIIIDLIPKVYERKRVMTILREDDSEQQIQLDPSAQMARGRTRVNGKSMPVFNPTIGKYGVTVTVGPSYATKRIEAAESMMDFIRAIAPAGPEKIGAIVDLVAKNMDWPEGEQVAARLAKLLPPNLLTPDMDGVPPQAQAVMQSMQMQLQQLTQVNQRLMQVLSSQEADRAQRQDKIDKDFEAKLIGVVQKAEAMYQSHVGSQLKDLAEGVSQLRDLLSHPSTMNGSSRDAF